MLPSSALCRLATRATTLFTTSGPSSSTNHFPTLVQCTRALVLLAKPPSKGTEQAHLLRCLVQCTDATLDTLQRLPPTADVSPELLLVLFGVLRASADFWREEKAVQLAGLLGEHVDAVVLRTWRPSVLLAAVHAVAKACPSQSHLAFLTDALALLQHHEAQLTERDVATLLWCVAVLGAAPTQQRLWASLCRRATLQLPRMTSVSRLTLSQALLLQQECLCESQADLLRVVHAANREVERAAGSAPMYASRATTTQHSSSSGSGGGRGGRRAPPFYAAINRSPTSDEAPSRLTSQLLQHTTHALSDDALVRLLVTLLSSGGEATDELLLALAHVSQRTSLTERQCVQLLRAVRQWEAVHDGNVHITTSARPSPSSSCLTLVWQVRLHATQLLVRLATRPDLTTAPHDVLEALCVEHHADVVSSKSSSSSGASTRGAAVSVSSAEMWRAMCTVLATPSVRTTSFLHGRGGAELWTWVCIWTYAQAVEASLPVEAQDKERNLLATLHNDVQRYWPSNRERQDRCVEVIVASAQGTSTHLLSCVQDNAVAQARQLLEECVHVVEAAMSTLPTPSTLRLLAAVEEAPLVISSILQSLKSPLLAKLEGSASVSSNALPDMLRYLSTALARSQAGLRSHPRVSDAVLDVFVRLLAAEQHTALPVPQVELLVRCLEERQQLPTALEKAFMMLLTRRLGQTASFLSATTLPAAAMCRLVEVADRLPRPHEDGAATATRTLILATLLDVLVQRCVPACTTAEGIVAAALLLRLDVVGELRRVAELASALDERATALLSGGAQRWTATQKAYLVAALVCAQREPSRELLRALHGGDKQAALPH